MLTLRIKDESSATSLGRLLFRERRRAVRHAVGDRVMAVASDGTACDTKRICSLQLLNISDTGLGAIAQASVEPGTRMTVFFPPRGAERGFDLCGHVVRCQRREHGHELGIRFDARLAA